MEEKQKIWLGLGTALLAGTALASGAVGAGLQGPASSEAAYPADVAPWSGIQLAAGESGEGGEGGERGKAANPINSNAAYLTHLGLIRGHLDVGAELYRLGKPGAAATHMKHPEDELYASLRPALEARGAPGFEKELTALAKSVETQAGDDAVAAADRKLKAALAKAEQAVANPKATEIGAVIYGLVRHAAAEYDEAVKDGKVVESHEYQDALGFLRVAEDWVGKLDRAGADKAIVAEIREQIGVTKRAFPSIVPREKAALDPSVVHDAAARIEIATLGLKG